VARGPAIVVIAAVLIACGGGASRAPTSVSNDPPPQPTPVTWTLAWSDEFDGPAGAPVGDTWVFDLGDGCAAGICGWGNAEKEYYTSSTDNAALDGAGHLAIVAQTATASTSCWYGPGRYTSAKLTTRGTLAAAPGRVEASIRLPVGQGLWPAFWMLGDDFPTVGWPASGELDVMEYRGSTPRVSSSAVHGPGYSGATPFHHEQSTASGTLADDFHVYGVEWDANRVRFSVDGVVHYTVSRAEMAQYGPSVLGKPYFLILNLAVGGQFDGDPATDAIVPATMLVDYVRVYTASGG
jgi:beta-glucanase (GH16 family)